ncbi:hypothetical protein DMJ27_25140 [Vibrio parahaemolyticus]|nr:hypothetical protein [Vibrio parahaemolyticus]
MTFQYTFSTKALGAENSLTAQPFFRGKTLALSSLYLLMHNALLRCEARNTKASAYHLNHQT